jgi:hypothetical protein
MTARNAASQASRSANAHLRRLQAIEWRERMKPLFDAMDAAWQFLDSRLRHPRPDRLTA